MAVKDESELFRLSIDVLIRYLTDRRQHVNKAMSKLADSVDSWDSLKSTSLRSPEDLFRLANGPISDVDDLVQIAKIVDTALFKSYLAVKPTMLGPLCRLPNWCEVDELESLLMDAKVN